MTFYGGAEHALQDQYGNAKAGTPLTVHASEADALAGTNPLATLTSGADATWPVDVAAPEVWVRLPDKADGSPDIRHVVGQATAAEVATVASGLAAAQTALAGKADASQVQTAESAVVSLFQVAPKTAGWAPAEAEFNSFPNNGAGAGTYNHALHVGFNTGRHSGGAVTEGKPAVYMGLEDNFYDPDGDLSYGVEWYVGYVSPDGTTVAAADLRPFYTRVTDSTTNTVDKNVNTTFDIGSGPNGAWSLWGSIKSGKQLLTVNQSQMLLSLPLNVVGNVQISPLTGDSSISVKAFEAGKMARLNFQPGGKAAPTFRFEADPFNEIYLYDSVAGRIHVNFLSGASDAAALSEFRSSVKVLGNVGFYGTTPVAKPTVTGSRGGNAAVASLLAKLASLGLITDSSTA